MLKEKGLGTSSGLRIKNHSAGAGVGDSLPWSAITDKPPIWETNKPLVLPSFSTPPLAPVNGMKYYDTVRNTEMVYENGAWVAVLTGNQAILNRTASQTADFNITGNGQIDGQLRLYGSSPRVTFYQQDSTYRIGRSNTTMEIMSGGTILNQIGISGVYRIKTASQDRLVVDTDGSTNIHGPFRLIQTGAAPTSSSDTTGQNGEMRFTDTHFYFKYFGSWKRVAMSTF